MVLKDKEMKSTTYQDFMKSLLPIYLKHQDLDGTDDHLWWTWWLLVCFGNIFLLY